MKKLCVLVALLLLLTSCAAQKNGGGVEKTEAVTDAISLSSQMGFEMSAPATAKNVECAMVDDLIGQITFSFNSVVFVYRGSKVMNGSSLYRAERLDDTKSEIEIGDRATVSVYFDKEGGRIAEWSAGGTYYALTSVKGISDDQITELCDLIIPAAKGDSNEENV